MRAFYSGEPRPTRDWALLSAGALLIVILSIGWNLWQFSRVVDGGVLGSEQAPQPQLLDVTAVTTLFAERATLRTQFVSGYSFSDPSR